MSSNRRGVGLSAFTRNHISTAQYASHGNALRSAQSDSLQTQLSVFQQLLHQFSITHAKDIRSNPTFRAEFARMCNAIGVDPLASSHHKAAGGGGKDGGSFWAQMLGGSVNDFYFELAVRVVEVCRDTRAENGGIIAVAEVRQRVQKGKGIGGGMEVSDDDVLRAVSSLGPLGSGFTIMKLGHNQMIRSVPKELNTDQTTVLEAIQVLGYVTTSMLQLNLGWTRVRSMAVIDDLMTDSLVWVDRQAEETEYWSPTFIHEAAGS
ncbi:putative ELL complex subunit Eap30 [Mytilinidion resinicola]|uniref:Vacuolar-sorting protein SNF8 n=1 Tax=Mytilinidion resinicola TaxID=574789 RepID=A0A6A6Y7A0_9PEZI|nr:putative ELL complex subunit Eap30 [Mytilinidion resinicola]KAF2803854.1 putative ELL complex subunit Eap30 [Mytilinidion resinicola]